MKVPDEILEIFGWRGDHPNIADKDSVTSSAIAANLFAALGVESTSTASGQTLGRHLETAVQTYLERELRRLDPAQEWMVGSSPITSFVQYAHLDRISTILADEPTLRSEIGTDYVIEPDVTVGIVGPDGIHLHAAVSCKWTIRSDRVQNIRHEGVVLTRHRRGRQPHIVTVTAEPMPSRLAAIARGTGEVDCVYHVALEDLYESSRDLPQSDVLAELIDQDRLRPLTALPEVVALY